MTPAGAADEAGGLGRRIRPVDRDVPERQRHPRDGHPRAAGRRRLVPAAVQRPRRGAWTGSCRRRSSRPAWRLVIDTSGVPDLPETDQPAAARWRSPSKGMVVLQALAGALEEPTPARPPRRCRPSRRCRFRCVPSPGRTSRRTTTRAVAPGARPPSRWSASPVRRQEQHAAPRSPDAGSPEPASGEPPSRREAGQPAVAGRRRSDGRRSAMPRPALHLSAADHRRTGICRTPLPWCRTCRLSASTGCTCRRCWRPSRVPSTATTSSTTARSTTAAAATRGLAGVAEAAHAAGLGVLVDIVPNHVGVASPDAVGLVVGRAAPRPGVRARRGVRHRLGSADGQDPAAGARRRRRRARRAARSSDGELRYYEHRFPIADGTGGGTAARGARPGSTTS